MRFRKRPSPSTSLVFPRGVDTADELMASLQTDHGRKALETVLRVEALTNRRRGR